MGNTECIKKKHLKAIFKEKPNTVEKSTVILKKYFVYPSNPGQLPPKEPRKMTKAKEACVDIFVIFTYSINNK